MHGSTASTMSTGVSCLSAVAGGPEESGFPSAIVAPGEWFPTLTKKRPACEADRSSRQVFPLRLRRVVALVGAEPRTEDSADDAEDSEIHAGLHRDVPVGGICCLEHHRAATTSISLHRRVLPKARRNNVLIARILTRVDHDVVAVVDAAANHTVSLDLEEEHLFGRDEPSIDGDKSLSMLRNECRLARVNPSIKRHRLRAKRGTEAEEIDATRSGGVSLDISLFCKRLEQVGDGLRRLDFELLADVADAGLVRILGCEVEKVVIYRAFQ